MTTWNNVRYQQQGKLAKSQKLTKIEQYTIWQHGGYYIIPPSCQAQETPSNRGAERMQETEIMKDWEEVVSCRHDKPNALMKLQYWWLIAQDGNKIKSLNILPWIGEGHLFPHH